MAIGFVCILERLGIGGFERLRQSAFRRRVFACVAVTDVGNCESIGRNHHGDLVQIKLIKLR
jgi:hypothetical protein